MAKKLKNRKETFSTLHAYRTGRLGLGGGVVNGLASLITVDVRSRRSRIVEVRDPGIALRGDLVRVGDDLKRGLARELSIEKASRH